VIGLLQEALFNMLDKKPPPDYDSIEAEAWKANAKQVPARLLDNDKNIVKRNNPSKIVAIGFP